MKLPSYMLNLHTLFRTILCILSFGVCSGCSQNKLSSTFHYSTASKEELNGVQINSTEKAYLLQVTQLDSDSTEVSFIKSHPVYCPLDGVLTQNADTIFMNIGERCDPTQTEFTTESANIRFAWRFKLKNPGNYTFIPRVTGYRKTWPISIER
ncbi:hypothetical protein [Rufibacter roseolus]|uniref:hypothetical protein n=1 Tax=Rufibacter roseolus TaxID=2817375 RepID=UPI001B3107FD|nr:hypothetical protein [Rufibacter roseolus]